MSRALLVIDLQNDFLADGALPVAEGEQVIPVINALLPDYERSFAVRVWHPYDHGSFAAHYDEGRPGERIDLGGRPRLLRKTHCVQDEEGAEFPPGLETGRFDAIIDQAAAWDRDRHSAFHDEGEQPTGLDALLRAAGIEEIHLAGLSVDGGIGHTAREGRRLGYRAVVIEAACRGLADGELDDPEA